MNTYSQPEAVVVQSSLRGEGHERALFVSAVKVPNRSSPAHPTYKNPLVIYDRNDDLPDGNYELVLGGQTFRLVKYNGVYTSIP